MPKAQFKEPVNPYADPDIDSLLKEGKDPDSDAAADTGDITEAAKLAELLDNPHAIAEDVSADDLSQLADADHTFFAKPDEPAGKPEVEKPAAAEPAKPAEAAKPEDTSKGKQTDLDALNADNAVVRSEDGKHEIPFAMVKNLRSRLGDTTDELDLVKSELQLLKEKAVAKLPGDDTKLPETPEGEIDLDALRELIPEDVVKAIETTIGKNQVLNERLDKLESATEEAVQDEKAVIGEEIQGAMDGIPELSAWKSAAEAEGASVKERALWAMAVSVDKEMRADPEYQGLSFRERFLEVVSVVQDGKPSAAAAPAVEPAPDDKPKDGDDIAKKAKEKVEAAKAKGKVPTSMSEVPGGTPPAQSNSEAVSNLSVTALEKSFEGKTEADIDKMLSDI